MLSKIEHFLYFTLIFRLQAGARHEKVGISKTVTNGFAPYQTAGIMTRAYLLNLKPATPPANLLSLTRAVSVVCLMAVFCLPFTTQAIEVNPSQEQINKAVELGVLHKSSPEKLFEGYEFGERGIAVNGYLMTKLFEIAFRSAKMTLDKRPISKDSFTDILKKDHLLIPTYLIGTSEKDFDKVSISLRQGLKTIPAAKILRDPPKKQGCDKTDCVWSQDVYVGFYYKDFDPKRVAVLEIAYQAGSVEFPLAFANTR